ncbi:eCIS core domain-containing protein [Actinoplanes sp. CA-051413]|uniref:eCIS core domain-containing protein n=1 Tax=Actinoplanes sp. CA-051413 TaxID=3239899 RepID=UPI003D96DA20
MSVAFATREHPSVRGPDRVDAPAVHGPDQGRRPVWIQRCATGSPDGATCEQRLNDASASIQRITARDGGAPLPASVRRGWEPAFRADFSHVRIHSGPEVDGVTAALRARALTSGNDILIRSGSPRPGTPAGDRLLAHEVAHVVQQRRHPRSGGIDRGPADPLEIAADRAADQATSGATVSAAPAGGAGGPATIQRKLEVADPAAVPAGAPSGKTNASVVDGYIKSLCPDFGVSGGKVVPTGGRCPVPGAALAAESCGCLCTMHTHPDVWTILVNDADWPHTDPVTRTVTVHSGFSGVEFGAWTKGAGAHRFMYQNWRVLAHEMCGHARLFVRGTHPSGPPATHGGRPSHDPTVTIENKISGERGIAAADQRGLFADPHHGESLARVSIQEFPVGSSSVAALPAAQAAKLATATSFMNTAGVEADVAGHTDGAGNAADNAKISLDRAKAVKADLVGRGIPAARFIDVRGVGTAECATPGPQPACRKVDLFMYIMRGASITHP